VDVAACKRVVCGGSASGEKLDDVSDCGITSTSALLSFLRAGDALPGVKDGPMASFFRLSDDSFKKSSLSSLLASPPCGLDQKFNLLNTPPNISTVMDLARGEEQEHGDVLCCALELGSSFCGFFESENTDNSAFAVGKG
jgi:hypothetical protein